MTDTVEMVVGRLGMPDVGGSYFTFSNENNDLIWGFLAECHRRGWIYRGHDTMPWCPRCGTGLSQMEMNEGYQDREDPGLTVRFPLLDRPGESLLVWTTTPWTLAANVAAAVGPDLRYVKVRQGEDLFWLSRGTLKQVLQGPFQVVEEAAGADLVGWRYAGRSTTCRRFATRSPRPATSTASSRGATSARRRGPASSTSRPGCGAEDFQLGQTLGLPVVGPIDEDGRYYPNFGWLSGREAPAVTEAIIDDLERRSFFYHLEPYSHRYPHCWRCGTPLLFRLVDEWFISMGEVYDQPRETLTKAQVDASLRYQIMEVVDRIRWIPSFGYERELDWLLNMRDWMISKKRYYGLALPIYDCRGLRDVRRHRRSRGARAARDRGLGRVRGPHAAPAVRGRGQDRLPVVRRAGRRGSPTSATRGSTPASCPFSTIHYREDPEYWAKWFPADFVTESFPGQFRNWFYAMLAMSTVLRREEPFRTIFGYATLFGEDGRPMHKSVGQRDRVRRGRRADGRRRHALDVRVVAARRQHPVRLARGRRGAPRAARAVERVRVLRDLRAPGRLDARDRASPPVAERPALDRWILSRSAAVAAEVEARLRDFDAQAATRRGRRAHRRPVHLVPAAVAATGCRAAPAPTATRRSRPSTRRSSRSRGRRADPPVPERHDLPQPRRGRRRRRHPTAST